MITRTCCMLGKPPHTSAAFLPVSGTLVPSRLPLEGITVQR
jgi:hypothetical protein